MSPAAAGDEGAAEETSRAGLQARLEAAVDEAWSRAPELREPLLRAAARQLGQGRAAYRAIADLLDPEGAARRAKQQGSPAQAVAPAPPGPASPRREPAAPLPVETARPPHVARPGPEGACRR
jgi:hypothetical protein